MVQSKILQTLTNLMLYSALFASMFFMVSLLSEYRTQGFDYLNRVSLGIIAIILLLLMFAILDFRNKIFEARTIWSENLTSFLPLNMFLALGLWLFAYYHFTFSNHYNQNGLWCQYNLRAGGWGGNNWINGFYFHPILGITGLIISLITFCNIKYRLKQADFHKIVIELFPILVLFLLVIYHFYFIPKPYFNG